MRGVLCVCLHTLGREEGRLPKAQHQFPTATRHAFCSAEAPVGAALAPDPSPARLPPAASSRRTFIQVANHSLLLQEVIAQLLVQSEGQHVVRERAAGENPRASPAGFPGERAEELGPRLWDAHRGLPGIVSKN